MIDLHTHSTASDGALPPARLMELAAERGLSAIALTDHDTFAGLEAAEARAGTLGLRFIPGIEIEIDMETMGITGEFHLLGLAIRGDRGELEETLKTIRRSRDERNLRILDRMRAAGFDVSREELYGLAGGEVVSRAHFARLLVAKRIAGSIDQAFTRCLGRGKPFYEPRHCMNLTQAASLIGRAGGRAVIAHPYSLGLKGPAFHVFLQHCRDAGVSGIEAYHPNSTAKDCRKLERLGRRLGFIITAGSDFHGENMPQRRLGHTAGGKEISDSFLDGFA